MKKEDFQKILEHRLSEIKSVLARDEKVGDLMNYLILLEAALKEQK